MANKLQIKRGTKSSLPTLSAGELGYCTDTHDVYVGTGSANKIVGGPNPTFESLTVDANTLYVDKVNHRVGFGTTGPQTMIHLVYPSYIGKDTIQGLIRLTGQSNTENSGDVPSAGTAIEFYHKWSGGAEYAVARIAGRASQTYDGGLQIDVAQNAGSGESSWVHAATILDNGYTGLGKTNPASRLDVNGTITATAFSGPLTGNVTGNASGSSGSVTGLSLTNSSNGINPTNVTQNHLGYCNSVSLFGQTDGGVYATAYSSSWIHEIYGDFRSGQIAIRGKNNGTWQSWRTVLDSSNFTTYAIANTLVSAQGDIIYASAANTPARLPKGTAGQVLTMNSGATAPEWQTPSGAPAESETNDGSKSSNFTIDWSSSKKHKVTLAAAGLTVTFTAPSGATSGLILKIIQDGTGSRTITTWPATVKWAGGAAPTLSTAANAVDIVSFYWDGTNNYWGACANAFA